ncbi:MAG: hypothetical protein DMG04_19580 [Acidobacteria bacterium]|nr:MAG: hypothetical protein DMG04_19580 [Acidobacteriota bacterium]PYQ80122.1 MAG: hypothetical protein DMG03_23955 [Acidobacteriota bacterium]PYQ87616.1 MAG: hypothetical protein DMG02_20205 [Acidobacteriota bacterium]PYR09991.1 MAG: hypothetical protein DMF99_13180 [Acidobacteriota bacterium]
MSVAEIVEAIDGPLAITACGPADERCGQFSKCNVRDAQPFRNGARRRKCAAAESAPRRVRQDGFGRRTMSR